jgi:glycosyltransferase involved in cell wall biosynthesis
MPESDKEQVARRVLWVTPTMSSRFGGPTTTVANGVTAERTAGCRSDLLTTVGPEGPGDSEAAIERVRRSGATVHVFRRRSASASEETWGVSLRAVLWMFRHVRGYDVLHLQYVWCITSLAGCVIGKASGVPVVVTPHESLTEYDIDVASRSGTKRRLKKVLRHFYLRTVDCIVFMSRLEERDTDPGDRRTVLISHAVAEHSRPRDRSSEDGQALRVGFLGRNIPKKGIDRLIEAISLDPHGEWELFVAGPPGTDEFRSEQDALSRRLGVEGRVRWLGFVEDRARLFDRCDVLAMPSAYEAFGMVAAEAMSHGVPVIVPERSGVGEIVAEFEAGIVLEKGDPRELADVLARLRSDGKARQRMSDNGIRAVDQRLTYSAYAKATGELYESLSAAG